MTRATIKNVKRKDGKWKIELRNFQQLDAALGRDVLTAFCRCFVHVNRLNSTISCMHAPNLINLRSVSIMPA